MIVCFIAAANSGTMFYTVKLLRELGKNRKVVLITNDTGGINGVNTLKGFKRNSLMAFTALMKSVRRLSCRVVIVQYEYSFLGHPLLTQVQFLLFIFLTKLSRVGTVVTLHGILHPDNFKGFGRALSRVVLPAFYKLVALLTDYIVVLNPLQKKLLESYGVDGSKITIIPHGVDRCNGSAPAASEVPSKNPTILFHGFIRPSKGLLELIEAVKRLSEHGVKVRLLILGSLPYQFRERPEEREYVMRVISKCKELSSICEARLKRCSDEELLDAAGSSDIIVLPYTDRYVESSGVLHLFADCGKPVVVSRTPRFLADVVPGREVLAVQVNPKNIADAIKSLIENEALARRLAENLKAKARTRYWEVVAAMYSELLDRVT